MYLLDFSLTYPPAETDDHLTDTVTPSYSSFELNAVEQVWDVAAAQVRHVAGLNTLVQVWDVAAVQV